jgi:hypothetical protein
MIFALLQLEDCKEGFLYLCQRCRVLDLGVDVHEFRLILYVLRRMTTITTSGRTKHCMFQPALFNALIAWHSAEHLQLCNLGLSELSKNTGCKLHMNSELMGSIIRHTPRKVNVFHLTSSINSFQFSDM